MYPYYILIFFPFFVETVKFLLRPERNTFLAQKRSNYSIVVFFTIWCLMLAFRSTACGTDLVVYEQYFFRIQKFDFFDIFIYHPIEQLYFVFSWLVAQLYPNFRFFLVVVACLCTSIIGWFYWKESKHALLTILLFVTNAPFTMFYSGLRQSLAMLFIVPAYYLTKQKKLVPFFLIVLLASCFHTSAMVMLFLYPIFHIPLRSRHFALAILIVACFFLFNSQLFTNILPFLGERYIDRYGTIQQTNGFGMWAFFTLFLCLSFIIPDDRKISHEFSGLRNILVLMTLIQGFAPVHTLAMRMNYYFIMLFPIIIPKIFIRPKVGWENVAQFTKWGLVIFLTVFFFYKINYTENILRAWPYVAYWE